MGTSPRTEAVAQQLVISEHLEAGRREEGLREQGTGQRETEIKETTIY